MTNVHKERRQGERWLIDWQIERVCIMGFYLKTLRSFIYPCLVWLRKCCRHSFKAPYLNQTCVFSLAPGSVLTQLKTQTFSFWISFIINTELNNLSLSLNTRPHWKGSVAYSWGGRGAARAEGSHLQRTPAGACHGGQQGSKILEGEKNFRGKRKESHSIFGLPSVICMEKRSL